MNIKIKKIKDTATLPSHAHDTDAGMDMYASEMVTIKSGERVWVPTGIAMEIPEGYAGLVWDKSGLSMKNGIKTMGGVIDAGYRGEIMIGVANISDTDFIVEKGHKIAQMVIQKIEQPALDEVDELSGSTRGNKGFGSTGR